MTSSLRSALWTVPVAFALWFLIFAVPMGNFWLKLCFSALLLAVFGLAFSRGERASLFRYKRTHLWLGPLSALLLYGVFWTGKRVLSVLFPLAGREISSIYLNKAQLDPVMIGLLLLFIMGPAEEIYWHGFIQRRLSVELGSWKGVLVTTAIYTLVHVWAFNLTLLLAAGVCGLFWGLLYQRTQSLVPVILSHAIWDVTVFLLFPLN